MLVFLLSYPILTNLQIILSLLYHTYDKKAILKLHFFADFFESLFLLKLYAKYRKKRTSSTKLKSYLLNPANLIDFYPKEIAAEFENWQENKISGPSS